MRLLFVVEPAIDVLCELVERGRVVGALLRTGEQVSRLLRREVVERCSQCLQDRFPLLGLDFVVGPHHLHQQRRRRHVVAMLALLDRRGAGRGGDGGFEQSLERPDHGVSVSGGLAFESKAKQGCRH